MSLILVRVKRPGAVHHGHGGVYKTGETFEMDEKDFSESVPGFFERADGPIEQIKSKDLPDGDPATGPGVPKVEEPPEVLADPHQNAPAPKEEPVPIVSDEKNEPSGKTLKLKKR